MSRVRRAERVEQIERLSAIGLSPAQIAERIGLALSTVYAYRADPSGSRLRARRERYRGTCRRCGARTTGAGGREKAPAYCGPCSAALRRRWSEQRLLGAIRDWARLTGAPPVVADWSPLRTASGRRGSERYLAEPERWPSAALVSRRFGSFAAAIEAAGLEPRAPGGQPRWSEDRIGEAIKAWHERNGSAPTPAAWRHAGERHPAASTVHRVMGSWERALERAGR